MSERVAFIHSLAAGQSMAAACRQFGVSRQTGYKWLARFEAGGEAALEDRSRAPRRHPNQTPEPVVEAILAARASHPFWGARKLLAWLARRRPELELPAPSTASGILKRHGLVVPRKRRRRSAPTPPAPTAHVANDTWATDFKGEFRTGDRRYCYPLTIQDSASRFLIRCQGRRSTHGEIARPVFEAAFREFGLPTTILSDNGAPFASATFSGLTNLSAWWIELGIRLRRIEPGHPEQNGKLERLHRTLKHETATPASFNMGAQQRVFNRFRDEFNTERPHEALGNETPASRFTPSSRPLPSRPPTPDYDSAFTSRQLNARGELQLNRFRFTVSSALKKKLIGLEPIDDGVWKLWFHSHVLGSFNERTGVLSRPGLIQVVNRRQ